MFKLIPFFLLPFLATSLGLMAIESAADSPEHNLVEKLNELEASVSNAPKREIAFREERSFQFRSKPIELTGIITLNTPLPEIITWQFVV